MTHPRDEIICAGQRRVLVGFQFTWKSISVSECFAFLRSPVAVNLGMEKKKKKYFSSHFHAVAKEDSAASRQTKVQQSMGMDCFSHALTTSVR